MLRLSLRTRLLAGLGVVVVALVAVAFVVTSTTESYLVGQVDDRLRTADGGPWRDGPFGPAGGREPPRVVIPDELRNLRPPTDYYLAAVTADGDLVPRFDEGPGGDRRPAPAIDLAQAEHAAALNRDGNHHAGGNVALGDRGQVDRQAGGSHPFRRPFRYL